MADPNQTLTINFKTIADATGLNQLNQGLSNISGSINDQLKAAGAAFDPLTNTFKSIAQESAKLPALWEQSGVSLARARNEAVTLVRELAAGAPVSRTIGALVGSLGIQVGLAGIAAFSVLRAIDSWASGVVKAALEQEKFTENINKTKEAAIQAAKLATSFGDVVNLEQKMLGPIDQLVAKLHEAEVPVTGIKGVFEEISKNFFSTLTAGLSQGPFDFTGDKAAAAKKISDEIRKMVDELQTLRQIGKDNTSIFAGFNAEPLAQGIDDVQSKVNQLTATAVRLKTEFDLATNTTELANLSAQIFRNDQELNLWQNHLNQIIKSQDDLKTKVDETSSAIDKVDLQKLSPQERIDALKLQIQETTDKLKILGAESPAAALQLIVLGAVSKDTALDMLKLVGAITQLEGQLGAAEKQQSRIDATAGRKEETDALTTARERLATVEEHYRNELEGVNLLEQQGAITVQQADAQKRAAIQQYLADLARVRTELERLLQVEQASGNTKAVQGLRLEIERLDLAGKKAIGDLSNASDWGRFRSQIVALKNQWSDLGTQLGGFITQQAQNFASTMGNAIGALIFRTGNLKQAILQLGQAFVSQLATMVIQWVLSRTILSALNKAFGAADASAAEGQASAAAASWAPAATAASIASYGVASGLGLTAYLAAIATGVAGTVAAAGAGTGGGGFELGGYTGESGGIVHPREYVFPAPAVQFYGVDHLRNLHQIALTRPNYRGPGAASGGRTGSTGQGNVQVHFYPLMDRREIIKHMVSREGRKAIVDIARGRQIDL